MGFNLTPHVVFSEITAFYKETLKPWFFVTFNIIVRNTFPENFIEIPQVVRKI